MRDHKQSINQNSAFCNPVPDVMLLKVQKQFIYLIHYSFIYKNIQLKYE